MGKFKRGSYYSVNADIRGNSDFDVNLIAEDQKIKFKNISYSTDSDGALSFGVEGNTDEEVSVSVSSDRTSFSMEYRRIIMQMNYYENLWIELPDGIQKMTEDEKKLFLSTDVIRFCMDR